MTRIVFFEVAPYEHEALEAARFPDAEVRLVPEPLTLQTAHLAADAEVVSVFVYSRIDEALLGALPALRFVATRSTGFDHLDVAALNGRGILASYVPSYGENTVAEHAFALIFALSRRLQTAILKTRALDFGLAGLEGRDLRGRTLGVVGVGRIGVHAVRLGRGAGMQVVAFDVRENPALAEAERFAYVPFAELLERSDVVSLHAALSPATFHLFDRAAFARMKPGALLVNTARGGIVDTEALCEALDSGRLGGAGLDVFEGEELIKDEVQRLRQPLNQTQLRQLALCHSLLRRDNVILTPHVAFFTREGVGRLLDANLANIRAYLAGRPEHLVPGLQPGS
jgi:D-lactate dehydrogenase